MTKQRTLRVEFGSISSGTMRAEDLIPTFADTLRSLAESKAECTGAFTVGFDPYASALRLCDEADAIDWEDNDTSMDAQDGILEELFDALEWFAPPYAYFGAHPGDGADYGFWLSDDFPDHNFDGLRVNDTSEVPSDYSGEVLHVNDHGNMTLYSADKGELTEIWALV